MCHISSLPSRYGIGSLGRESFEFTDFLSSAGQTVWQILPISPTGFGDSPYSPLSAFAGNPYFISLELLAFEHLLTDEELEQAVTYSETVDYGFVYSTRSRLLKLAADRFAGDKRYDDFVSNNAYWLDDYSFFMALKSYFGSRPLDEWDDAVRFAEPDETERLRTELSYEIEVFKRIQYFFQKQFTMLKNYAAARGVRLLGDIPVYVPYDSADFFAERKNFLTDSDGRPSLVSGVPPDYFSESGQLWGTPVYDWKFMKSDGYKWWLARLRRQSELFDAVRIDHFRGFSEFWAVPAGARDAKEGSWLKACGKELFKAVSKELPTLEILAEDLGTIDDGVHELLDETGFAGMKVLQFAFDGSDSAYLPKNYTENCIVYTGTHDNDTSKGFLDSDSDEAKRALELLGEGSDSAVRRFIRLAMQSVAALCIIPMQDWLEKDSTARMNTPSTDIGNWCWRLKDDELSELTAEKIRAETAVAERLNQDE